MSNKTQQGLPCNLDAERFVLGAILLDDTNLDRVGDLHPADFSLRKHLIIFQRMIDIKTDGERVDRVTLAGRLMDHGEMEAVDGLGYLISLDDGMPQTTHFESYVRTVKDKSVLRRMIHGANHLINQCILQDQPTSQILHGASEMVAGFQVDAGREQGSVTVGQVIEEHGGVESFVNSAIDPGISWGYDGFDDHMLGLQKGCQYIIAGRTSSGKSSLAMNVARKVAGAGHGVTVLSLEMSKEITIARMICSEAEVPLKAYIKRDLNQEQRAKILHAVGELADLPLYIDDSPGMTITGMVQRINQDVRRKNIRLFILDHIHRIDWAGDKSLGLRTEYEGITKASWAGALLTRQHNISSIILCQLSRPADKRKESAPPVMSELRSTGALEQDGTGIVMLHRPEQFAPGRPDLRGKATGHVRKSRNGSIGDVVLNFRSAWTTFYPSDEEPGFDSGEDGGDD